MRKLCLAIGALALVAVLAAPAFAQGQGQGRRGGRGGGGLNSPVTYLNAESVQKELGITADDVKKVTDAIAAIDQQASREERAEKTTKAVTDNLKPEALKRLHQIMWQKQGIAQVIDSTEVAAAMKLDDKQKEKVKTIKEDLTKKIQDITQAAGGGAGGGGGGGRGRRGAGGAANNPQVVEARKKANEDIVALLTDDQKKAWADLTGPEFKGEIPLGGRGRRGNQ